MGTLRSVVCALMLATGCGEVKTGGPDAALCDASFAVSAAPTIGGNVTFTPATANATYEWEFDATTTPMASSDAIANVSYAMFGDHTAKLTVSKADCARATSQQTVTVHGSLTYMATGSMQTLVVPTGVTMLHVDLKGASGGVGNGALVGGKGGQAVGDAAVTPGESLALFVGGKGIDVPSTGLAAGYVGGFNGGGSVHEFLAWGGQAEGVSGTGGGASDIRRGGIDVANRIVIAGGGGGAGNSNGGDGGGAMGVTAGPASGVGGGGGTQAGGGSAAMLAPNYPNTPGVPGVGGNAYRDGAASGGGGGGYFGGGGGQFAGGGGGSSFILPLTNATTTAGVNVGDGVIVLTF